MKKVTVIGGGISGLAAAYTLEQKGRRNYFITLVEARPRLGGKLQTAKKDGFTIEGGPDCYLAQKPAVARLSKEIGIDGDLIGTSEENKGTFILWTGNFMFCPKA